MFFEYFIIKKKILKKLKGAGFQQSDAVLDLGSGRNPYYRNSIKGKIINLDIGNLDNVNVVGDANRLPFKKSSFDKVISINSFYYLDNPFRVAEDVSRILKENGTFVMVLPFYYPIHDMPYDKYRFTESGIRSVLKEKFDVERIEAVGGIFTLPSVFIHSLMRLLQGIFPNPLKWIGKLLSYILVPLYVVVQLLSCLDFIDISKRIPTYYFVVASKK